MEQNYTVRNGIPAKDLKVGDRIQMNREIIKITESQHFITFETLLIGFQRRIERTVKFKKTTLLRNVLVLED